MATSEQRKTPPAVCARVLRERKKERLDAQSEVSKEEVRPTGASERLEFACVHWRKLRAPDLCVSVGLFCEQQVAIRKADQSWKRLSISLCNTLAQRFSTSLGSMSSSSGRTLYETIDLHKDMLLQITLAFPPCCFLVSRSLSLPIGSKGVTISDSLPRLSNVSELCMA